MRLKAILLSSLCAISLPFTATAQETFEIPVDGNFFDANMRWNGATAGGYDAKMKLIVDREGYLALCGIGRVTNVQLSSAIRKGLRGGQLVVDGRPVLKNFSFFTRARKATEVTAGTATCKSSPVKPPQSADSIDIRYGDATFRN